MATTRRTNKADETNDAADTPTQSTAPTAATPSGQNRQGMQSEFIKVTSPFKGEREYLPLDNIRLITALDATARKQTIDRMTQAGFTHIPDAKNLNLQIDFHEAVNDKRTQLAQESIAQLQAQNLPLFHIGDDRYILFSSIGTISEYTAADQEKMEQRMRDRGQTEPVEHRDWKAKIRLKPNGMVLSTIDAQTLASAQRRGPAPTAKPF